MEWDFTSCKVVLWVRSYKSNSIVFYTYKYTDLGLFSRCLSGGLSLSVLAGVSVADWVSPSSSCITCPLQSNSLCTTSVAGLLNTPSNKSACLSLLQHNSHKNHHNTKKLKILIKYESTTHRLDEQAQKHQYTFYQIWVFQVRLKFIT